jgi:phosphoribosylanthranilate isomerase
MIVKVCGITTEEDAAAAIEAGAHALGFNFYDRSPRYIAPERAAAIAQSVGATAIKVGIFVDAETAEMECIAKAVGLDAAQVYGDFAPAGTRIWRACRVTEFSPAMFNSAEAVLVDTPSQQLLGGTGEAWDWSAARDLGPRIVLAGGLDDSNVARAIDAARPWGVDACSRLESEPGRKDHAKVRRFVKAALNA